MARRLTTASVLHKKRSNAHAWARRASLLSFPTVVRSESILGLALGAHSLNGLTIRKWGGNLGVIGGAKGDRTPDLMTASLKLL